MDNKKYIVTLPNGEKANLGMSDGVEFLFQDFLSKFEEKDKEIVKKNLIAAIQNTK